MSRHRMRFPSSLLLIAALAACDQAGSGGSSDTADGGGARAVYSREIFFVAADATGAALLDFGAADIGSGVRRTARAWAEAGSGWTPLYDLSWQGSAVPRPWRLVPRGPIRLRVGYSGEVEGIAVREADVDHAALETGDLIAVWDPGRTVQIVLREGTLALGGEPMRGWLVDARFGVTREAADDTMPGFAPDDAEPPAGVGRPGETGPPADSLADDDAGAPVSRAATPPVSRTDRDAVVRTVRGVLVGARGETLVIVETGAGLGGWLRTADDEEIAIPTLTLARTTGEREGWSIEGGGAVGLSGALTVMDEEPLPVSPRIVRGTLRVRGTSLDVHGVLRPSRRGG